MSIVDRFCGKEGETKRLVANPNINDAFDFQILFSGTFNLDELGLTRALRAHPLCSKTARVEIEPSCAANGTSLGLAGWGEHVIQILGFNNVPMPADVLAHSLQVSHCEPSFKAEVRKHKSHILLKYAGYDAEPFSCYQALAILAGVFADTGALMVVNLRATSCIPAEMLSITQNPYFEETFAEYIPAMLYCGFVKYFIEGTAGGWVRTIGADALHLPDLSANLVDMKYAEEYFLMFKEIHGYIKNTGKTIDAGDTLHLGGDRHYKLRNPDDEKEYFLNSDGVMLIVEQGSELESKRVEAGKVRKPEKT